MSKVEASDVPTGYQVVSCTAYDNRVAALSGGQINAKVISWPYQGSPNELWTFVRQGVEDSKYKLSTTATSIGGTVFATSDPVPGNSIYCTEFGTLYSVVPLTPGQGNYKISVIGEDGTELYWTLDNDGDGTPITLETRNGNSTQVWAIYEPSLKL